jgi:hypothetical protein
VRESTLSTPHQYIDRGAGRVCDERLYGDGLVRWLYSEVRENAPALYRLILSPRVSGLLGFINYDLPLGGAIRVFTGRAAAQTRSYFNAGA